MVSHTGSCRNFISFVPKAKVKQPDLDECFAHPDKNSKTDNCCIVFGCCETGTTDTKENDREPELARWTDYPHSEIGWEHEDHVSNDYKVELVRNDYWFGAWGLETYRTSSSS